MTNIFRDTFAGIAPDTVDVFTPLGYFPTEKQKTFHRVSQEERAFAILFGGARGGGKSAALTMEAIHWAVNVPGFRVLCLRRTYGELEESFLNELAKRQYARPLGGKWNQSEKRLRFPNGSVINFSFAENEIDASRLLGGEYQLICIDEASRTLPKIIEHAQENLRSGSRLIPVIGLRLATNPGGTGHQYLKNRFIATTSKNGGITLDPQGRKIAYIKSLYTDNPHLDAGYEAVLNAIEDPARRKAMKDGDWDAMVGQFFEQLTPDRHCVPVSAFGKPLRLPDPWTRYTGVDYGSDTRSPTFAAVTAACDNDGRLWVYREIYAAGTDAKTQAHLILDAEKFNGDHDVVRVADPSMWGNRGTPMTIADIYGLEGCGLYQADNDRTCGWARVHMFLNDGPACEYHRSLGWDSCPMLHVFEEECPEWWRTMTSLPRDENKPDDAATKGVEDHIPDATRYLCMQVGTSASPVFYDDDDKTPAERAVEQLQRETAAAFDPTPTMPLVAGRFAGNLGMRFN